MTLVLSVIYEGPIDSDEQVTDAARKIVAAWENDVTELQTVTTNSASP
jgi:hypothetical protein